MKIAAKKTDWLDSHLYLSHKFNAELKVHGIYTLGDIEEVTLYALLNFKTITIPRLKRIVFFMRMHGLQFKKDIVHQ